MPEKHPVSGAAVPAGSTPDRGHGGTVAPDYGERCGEKRKLARACGPDQLILSGAAGNRNRCSTRHFGLRTAVSLRLGPVQSRSFPAVMFSGLDGVNAHDLLPGLAGLVGLVGF